MKKTLFIGFMAMVTLTGCTTYKPYFPAPEERVNPYDQKPVPDDGAASMLRNVIRR